MLRGFESPKFFDLSFVRFSTLCTPYNEIFHTRNGRLNATERAKGGCTGENFLDSKEKDFNLRMN